MAGGAQQQQQQGGDNSLGLLWIFALVFVTGGLVWYFAHAYIVAFIFKIKLYESYLVELFTDSVGRVIRLLQSANPATATFQDVIEVSELVGDYFRYPTFGILLILAILLYKSDIKQTFRKTYNTTNLLKEELDSWPHVTPVANLNLIDEDLDKGPWAMGMAPLAFAKKHHLLKREYADDGTVVNRRAERKAGIRVGIKRAETRRLFTLQLGNYWGGIASLKPTTRAVFALCAAKMNRDRNAVDTLSTQISRSSATGKLDFSGVDEVLKKHLESKKVQAIIARHAYPLTIMASLLEGAREDGVFSTAEFLWLKPVNRQLWYMLNNVGRQTAFVEVAGPFAHWLAEKELNRPCIVPMVEEAVKGLEEAIKDIKFKPEDVPE